MATVNAIRRRDLIEGAGDVERARARVKKLAAFSPGEYIIANRQTGERISIKSPVKQIVFQIGYDEKDLNARAELFRRCGHQVMSVAENEAAKRALTSIQNVDVFVVGHTAPEETIQECHIVLSANAAAGFDDVIHVENFWESVARPYADRQITRTCVENVVRRLRLNRRAGIDVPVWKVILEASIEVRSAIIYATLIDVVALLPVFLMKGLSGSFFQPLVLSYALAVMASLAVALTITPALALILLGLMGSAIAFSIAIYLAYLMPHPFDHDLIRECTCKMHSKMYPSF